MQKNNSRENESEEIDVLLIDDHSLVAELVAKYLPLEGAFSVTVAKSREEGLAKIASRGAFDVVLLDVLLPERLTLEQIVEVVSANDAGSVVLFSGNVSEDFVNESLAVGTFGFIPKTLSLRSLASSINLVASGEPFVPSAYFKSVNKPDTPNKFDINPGELEVLEKLGQGYSNKEIMNELDLPETTVKMRVRGLSRKLGARNRTHAVIIAREASLI